MALRGDPLTIPEHIQMIIDKEKKEKPGNEEKIKSLHELKKTFTEKNDSTPADQHSG
ncbi:LOW QUALITY PROTEIN: hypothetical protein DAPPUDRAFT_246441 [Daphnia pulex]|uniref:Uncharacterized protein n=1 Tax=Daphnia pulex TaxID=6669 RepID=E9GQI5_DAPPU|nr:LOW QUALITY PROTEIN: hypothetical protein DAPPUDRAFT_246441 [Daphnia pulex]|eukprot:EFX78327.1 LOW QUALITY PROTEIN: hypothetical protein DAPPUDRAFT_246441 [Daphnia pulex]